MLDSLLQDVRYGLRLLARKPGFAAIAVLTLALGIGANTAIFSVVNAVLLRSLPFPEPDRLVFAAEFLGGRPMPVSYPNFLDWRSQQRALEKLAAYSADDFNLSGLDRADRVTGELVSDDYFDLLGVTAIRGRAFLPEEATKPGSAPVAVIGHAFWKTRFGGDDHVVGRTVKFNEADFTIVGVAPEGFRGFSGIAEVWMPITMRDALYPATARFTFLKARDIHWHRVLGRLKPGVTLAAAQAEMDAIGARIAHDFPQANEGRGVTLIAARERVVGKLRTPLFILLAAVVFVLLIACANVANLFLSRAAARSREIAIRLALGASRWRIVRQLLTESLIVAAIGGVAGLLLSLWGVELLISILPISLPSFATVAVDPRVLVFTSLVSIITGVMMGVVPALQASRTVLNETLKESGRSTTGRRGNRVRGALVATEIALALMLMIGAGLMLRSFARMLATDPGFDPDHLVTLRFDIPNRKYQGEQRTTLAQRLVERIGAVPGVASVGATMLDPFVWDGINLAYTIEGKPAIPPAERDTVYYHNISPNYFRTMAIPLKSGRDFGLNDDLRSPPVMIVSSSFARRYWPGEDALGKRVKFGPEDSTAPWMTVVGVASDMKFRTLRQDENAEPIIYTPLLQNQVVVSISLIARTSVDPSHMLGTLREAVQAFDADIPVYSVATLEDRLRDQTAETRSYALLLSLFAILAMLLAAIGIYGVMSYSVTQRTHEIGVRVALGAQPRDVRRLVVREGLLIAVMGLAAGFIGALMLTRLMTTLLFNVSPTDPVTFAAIGSALLAVALAACFVPARRATRVDPMVALRCE
ncbi:MAG TPA: ABC transporter permease [Blastocatellia bacterium]|nr:ABC transporter permease [Blastocatellia bacterium]